MIDFITLCGNNGIILNQDELKFQFCTKTANFAGFCITPTEIKPLDKYINAIKEFPTPKKLADIRSWFGLVNQVGYYNRLCKVMAPFKLLLSPKQKFIWTEELDQAFCPQSSSTPSSRGLPSSFFIVELVSVWIGPKLTSAGPA